MNETNSSVSSQAVSSAPLDTSGSDTSLAPSSSLAADSSSVVTSEPAADSSSLPLDESTSIDVSSLSQSVASSVSSSMSTSVTVSTSDVDQFLTKPINEYTPTEGFLFLLVLLAFAALIFSVFGLWRAK